MTGRVLIGDAIMAVAAGDFEVKAKRARGTGVHSKIQDALRMGGSKIE